MAKIILEFEKPVFELEQKIEEVKKLGQTIDLSKEIKTLEQKLDQMKQRVYKHLTRWQKVQIARHPERPYTLDYINMMTTDFIELHGDRSFRDDKALVGGFAMLDQEAVMIIGTQKGRDTKQNLYRNFGMLNPEGYRKALRLMKLSRT
jgi:acetyl-CoA carboxylase carboxyl transferase subunit alpha